jgi:hypothetical protein
MVVPKYNLATRIALLGAVMMFIVIAGSTIADDGHTLVPLLALLAICEFGCIISLVGIYVGYRHRQLSTGAVRYIAIGGCAVLAVLFALKGAALWPM